MTLFENPIWLTQKRLAHRAGVVAPVLVGLLIGLSLLAGLMYQLHDYARRGVPLQEDAGRVFYAWLLALQALVLVVGGFSRISRTLVEERRSGLLDSNRLTPLPAPTLVAGYWLGAGLREVYVTAALAPVGLVMVLLARLPVGLWLGTQALLVTTALCTGLLAVLAGMVLRRAQGGVGALVALPPLLMMMVGASKLSLTNYLMPFHATLHLFGATSARGSPAFFGWEVPTLAYTGAAQLMLGVWLWRGAVRKLNDPFRPALSRMEVFSVFGTLLLLQHGLVWQRWSDSYSPAVLDGGQIVLPMVQAGTFLLGLVLIGSMSLQPEQVRIRALQGAGAARGWILTRGGPATAGILFGIASVLMLTHFAGGAAADWHRYGIAAANLAAVYGSFAFLLELCRVSFRRRSLGFVVLGLFVLYMLPYLLALVFRSEAVSRFSVLSPGVVALAAESDVTVIEQWPAVATHLGIVAGLAFFWWNRWGNWLDRAVVTPRSSAAPGR